MLYRKQLRQCGRILTAPKQGRKAKDKDVADKNRVKDICLNCTAPKCTGKCHDFEKKRSGD